MMTDGTSRPRRTKSGQLKLVPVENREAHEDRVESMRNHPAGWTKKPRHRAGLILIEDDDVD